MSRRLGAIIKTVMGRMNRIGLATVLGLVACSSPLSPAAKPGPPATGESCTCSSGDGVLALPTDLPALPTYVESDTCQAVLAPGGLSVRTSTPKDCKIQVTLANGEVR